MGKTLRKVRVESLNRRKLHSQLLYTYCWPCLPDGDAARCWGRRRSAGGETVGVQICRDSFLLLGLFTVFSLQFPQQLVTFFRLPLPFSVYLFSLFSVFFMYFFIITFDSQRRRVHCGSVSFDFRSYLYIQNTQKGINVKEDSKAIRYFVLS